MPFEPRDLDRMMGDPWRMELPPTCPRCDFNLSGTDSNRCPECGLIYVRSAISEHARRMQAELRRMSNMNDLASTGFKIVLAGGGILILGIIRAKHTPSLDEVARLIGVISGVFGLSLGLNVFRIKRFPDWVLEYIPKQPNFPLAILTGVLGVLLITFSVV